MPSAEWLQPRWIYLRNREVVEDKEIGHLMTGTRTIPSNILFWSMGLLGFFLGFWDTDFKIVAMVKFLHLFPEAKQFWLKYNRLF